MVIQELESSDTVQYISQLEEKLKSRESILSDQSKQINSLRHAKEALARSKGKHKVRNNPATSSKGGMGSTSRVTTQSVKNSTEMTYMFSPARSQKQGAL